MDSLYAPAVADPAFPAGEGPVVLIDEAHHNLHVADGSFGPFARLLERDGYVVRPGVEPFSAGIPDGASVVVIANAIGGAGARRWPPPAESAFDAAEIAAIEEWVREGGALLLIADHMPFSSAATDLAAAFGVEILDGYAIDPETWDPMIFRRGDGSVGHGIVDGPAGSVDSVASFSGSAIRPSEGVRPVLVLPAGVYLFTPTRPWDIDGATPRVPAGGFLQGAILGHGDGRVAVFSEAAMFTAQRTGSRAEPVGMNHPAASQNHRLVRNLLHWLAGSPVEP